MEEGERNQEGERRDNVNSAEISGSEIWEVPQMLFC